MAERPTGEGADKAMRIEAARAVSAAPIGDGHWSGITRASEGAKAVSVLLEGAGQARLWLKASEGTRGAIAQVVGAGA